MAKRLLSRIAVACGTALAFIALIFVLIWLGTHQASLSSAGPLMLVIGLGAMVYGARSKKKPAPVSTVTNDALAAVTGRTLRNEADLVEGHIATGQAADANSVLDDLYQRGQDRFSSDASPNNGPPSTQKPLQFEIAERPVKLRPAPPSDT
jgi:hypothetical protein